MFYNIAGGNEDLNTRQKLSQNSGETICSRYQPALLDYGARLCILNLIAQLC